MNPDPEVRPTRLADGRVDPPVFVTATVIRRVQPTRLAEVETLWTPARAELAAVIETGGEYLENSHWNWVGKIPRVEAGELFLVGVECEGQVQGLMAIPFQPRLTTLTPGERLVYIDYVEARPGISVPGHPPRFSVSGSAAIVRPSSSAGNWDCAAASGCTRFHKRKCLPGEVWNDATGHGPALRPRISSTLKRSYRGSPRRDRHDRPHDVLDGRSAGGRRPVHPPGCGVAARELEAKSEKPCGRRSGPSGWTGSSPSTGLPAEVQPQIKSAREHAQAVADAAA